jgi:hypothetical protein
MGPICPLQNFVLTDWNGEQSHPTFRRLLEVVSNSRKRKFDPANDGLRVIQWASEHKARNAWDMGPRNFERCLFDLSLHGGVYRELTYNADGYLKYQ